MKHRTTLTVAAALSCALLAGCPDKKKDGDLPTVSGTPADLGLADGLSAVTILDGLQNPSFVTFDARGRLTVCDSGNGRVLVETDAGTFEPVVEGLATEFWKVDVASGTERFQLGALAALWLPDGRLVVSNAGLKDGEDNLLFYPRGGGDPEPSNAVPPTSDDSLDNGEGNLCGFSLSPDGETLFVAGQGADAKSWVLACNTETRVLRPILSADDAGIEVNSPMHTQPLPEGRLLVLYSGAGGVDDGLFVEWDLRSARPVAQWTLPGLTDPMGFAPLPSGRGYAVVDNNWALTEVKEGRVAVVRLPEGGGEAEVEVVASRVPGPVACAFGAEGVLYVTLLGERFDEGLGSVVAITGIE